MKILIITSSYPYDDQDYRGIFVKEMADIFKQIGHEVFILKPDQKRYSGIFNGDGAIEMLRQNSFRSFLLPLFFLEQIISGLKRSRKFDAILSHWLLPSGLSGAVLSMITGMPHFCVVHSIEPWMSGNFLIRQIVKKFIIPNTKGFFCVNKKIESQIKEFTDNSQCKTYQIPTGINVLEYMGTEALPMERETASPSPLKILFLGRLIKIKGVDVLLKSVSKIDTVEVIIAGNGPLKNELEQLAFELGINAKFYGEVSKEKKKILLSECDVLVIPSTKLPSGREEGLPRVLLEGMASGLVVVASRTGGIPEIINQRENGFLFDFGDCDGLRKIILMIKNRKIDLRQISKNAIDTAIKYDWKLLGKEIIDVIILSNISRINNLKSK